MAEHRTSYDAFVKFMSTPISDGQPFVLETQHAVSLHFDHFATQSFMSLRNPEKLTLGYTRAMMGFLLLRPAPTHICMIGLGGGSLAKYCYRHLPEVAIDAVEISPEVIALRDVFRIPADDARFKVICADGADYLMQDDIRTDVILLDAFVAEGMASRCANLAFFAACRERLTETGVLVINLTDDDPAIPQHLEWQRSVFGVCYAIARCGDDSNFVAFAWKSGQRLPPRQVLFERALSFAFADELKLSATARHLKEGERLDPKRLVWREQGQGHWEIGG
ncbi:spermine/spermidine synthase domain-containing protein [Paraburkholderia atlantica]|uniref:spermine/spermidine synthase domain-containing protein n=1 Tax=Paraburkholderia atlantica TaxID=2654982 RepID=UPI001610EE4B|nr:spermidine synthase [Paraburkholderia atlantica]MBB5507340.1 spermidine synthase [Paraburkholderia atlantica]